MVDIGKMLDKTVFNQTFQSSPGQPADVHVVLYVVSAHLKAMRQFLIASCAAQGLGKSSVVIL